MKLYLMGDPVCRCVPGTLHDRSSSAGLSAAAAGGPGSVSRDGALLLRLLLSPFTDLHMTEPSFCLDTHTHTHTHTHTKNASIILKKIIKSQRKKKEERMNREELQKQPENK